MKKIFTLLLSIAIFAPVVLNAQGTKKVLLEEMTGAWCGFCTDGALKVQQLHTAYPGIIVSTALHNGDAMASPSTGIINQFPPSGYPAGMVDRVQFPNEQNVPFSRSLWAGRVASQLLQSTPVDVTITPTWDPVQRMVDVEVSAVFTQGAAGDMRIHCLFIEDKVTGSGSGYNQQNYYSSTHSWGAANASPSHPYYSQGHPIVGYEHEDVVRYVASPTLGTPGVIPMNVLAGTYTQNYSWTVPAGYDETEMHIVAFVSAPDNSVMNVNEIPLLFGVGIDENEPVALSGIYPNPVKTGLTSQIEYNIKKSANVQIEVYNSLGKHVSTLRNEYTNAGNHQQVIDTRDLTPGFYFVSLKTQDGMVTKKFSVVE